MKMQINNNKLTWDDVIGWLLLWATIAYVGIYHVLWLAILNH